MKRIYSFLKDYHKSVMLWTDSIDVPSDQRWPDDRIEIEGQVYRGLWLQSGRATLLFYVAASVSENLAKQAVEAWDKSGATSFQFGIPD